MSEVNIQKIKKQWSSELQERVNNLKAKGVNPKLVVINDGDMSNGKEIYMKNKQKRCESLGIEFEKITLDVRDKTKSLQQMAIYNTIATMSLYNELETMPCIIVQLPFGDLKESDIKDLINPVLDVDGFSDKQRLKLLNGDKDALIPATALGVARIIEDKYGKDLSGKNVCIVSRSSLIGKPLYQLLLQRNATVTTAHSRTEGVYRHFLISDIIVTGCGQRKIFNSDDLFDWEVCDIKTELIIDCSMYREQGIEGVGDFDKEEVIENCPQVDIASGYGNTGTLTCIALCENVIKSYENRLK
jgi:methylenetetrahydrofolate dehydrogenase (NADP+)/methenyltetrahydrofolate cyclohydrolase